MMKNFVLTLISCFFSVHLFAFVQQGKGMVVLDEELNQTLPKKFRMLEDLHLAGSGQFSETSLKNILPKMKGKIWMIDLRRESHGFVNGLPVSWYFDQNKSNEKLSAIAIEQKEQQLLLDLKKQSSIVLHYIVRKENGVIQETQDYPIQVKWVETEKQLASKNHLGYLRIPVLDHYAPDDESVDDFLAFYQKTDKADWLYFHCRGGKGRSTTWMVMVDILRNASHQTLQEILKRQEDLGGSHLYFDNTKHKSADWKEKSMITRRAFIQAFYQYVIDPQGYPHQTWDKWQTTIEK